ANLYVRTARHLKQYSGIADAEAYQAKCEAEAQAAVARREALLTEVEAATEQLAAYKTRSAQYQQLLGRFQSVAELQKRIESDTARVNQLAQMIGGLEQVAQLNLHIQRLDAAVAQKQAEQRLFARHRHGADCGRDRRSGHLLRKLPGATSGRRRSRR